MEALMKKTIVCTWILQNRTRFVLMLNDKNKLNSPRWSFPRTILRKNQSPATALKKWLENNMNYHGPIQLPFKKIFIINHYSVKQQTQERFYHVNCPELIAPSSKEIEFFTLDEIDGLCLGFWHKEIFTIFKKYLIEKAKTEIKEKIKRVVIFSNGTEKDIKAIRLLEKYGVPFVNFGPISENQTPILEYEYWRYYGLKDIELFIESFKTAFLPKTLKEGLA